MACPRTAQSSCSTTHNRPSSASTSPARCTSSQKTHVTAGEFDASFADARIETVGLNDRDRSGAGQRFHALVVGGAGAYESQVFADRTGEEVRVVRNDTDALPQLRQIELADVGPVPAY